MRPYPFSDQLISWPGLLREGEIFIYPRKGLLMTNIKTLFVGFTVALASWLTAGSAYATNDHSWVSSGGSGTACTRIAPCASFFIAQAATNAGGVISVVDPADYLGVTITKSLTVRVEGADGGMSAAAPGPWINVQAGATDGVTLEGLHIGGNGIKFISGGHLHIVRCVIANGNAAGDAGISFAPTGTSKLTITDTVISNMGSGTGGGIVINPQSGGTAQVALERVTVNGNAFGIAADGSNSTGGINMTIADSMIANNAQDGIIAVTSSGGAPIGVYVKNTKSVNNAFGIRSIGPNVTVRVDGSSAIGNSTGLSFSGGGVLLTAGNNMVRTNGTDGAFSGPVALQ
jgi:hypothetical protein